jgi:hypothetical protein
MTGHCGTSGDRRGEHNPVRLLTINWATGPPRGSSSLPDRTRVRGRGTTGSTRGSAVERNDVPWHVRPFMEVRSTAGNMLLSQIPLCGDYDTNALGCGHHVGLGPTRCAPVGQSQQGHTINSGWQWTSSGGGCGAGRIPARTLSPHRSTTSDGEDTHRPRGTAAIPTRSTLMVTVTSQLRPVRYEQRSGTVKG